MKFLKILLFIFFVIVFHNSLKAQEPVLILDFDTNTFSEKITKKEDASSVMDLQQSQYAEGLTGKALDLSENAILRRPIKLNKDLNKVYKKNTSFSIQIWVKTIPNAKMGSPLMGNKKADSLNNVGWQIYSQENGAWALNISDGKNRYDYKPTYERQKINDGKWHQIVFTVNREKQELWMYLDGKNVAIYHTPWMKGYDTKYATFVGGGVNESYDQWYAFNGYIDEVKIWDTTIDANKVGELYSKHFILQEETAKFSPEHIKVMAWNIWHGGHSFGKIVGTQRVIETIQATNADIIGLIETYGAGEVIADALGYYYYLISTNLSIMSRFPITETVKAFKPFNFGGAKLKLGPDKELIYFDTWLHYLPDYLTDVEKGKDTKSLITAEGKTRHGEIKRILKEIKPLLNESKNIPVIMSGDFNVGSHLDWIDTTKDIHNGRVIKWPVSEEMIKAGFKDSFREMNIDPLKDPGFTWSPLASPSSKKYGLTDRIDFIYYIGDQLYPIESKVIDYHPIMFPSDHAGVLTMFRIK